MNPCEYSLELKNNPVALECGSKGGRCNYTKLGQGFDYDNLAPKGLCPEAYHNLYHSSLTPLFGGNLPKNQKMVKCSGVDNYVVYRASFEKLNFRFRLFNIIKYLLRKVYFGQIYKGRLAWTVSEVKGTCPLNQKVGDRFFINQGNMQIKGNLTLNLGEPLGLCPAVFDNLFPYLYGFKKEGGFPFQDKGKLIQCPDHNVSVTFGVEESCQ